MDQAEKEKLGIALGAHLHLRLAKLGAVFKDAEGIAREAIVAYGEHVDQPIRMWLFL
jgi:hypothetical protein